MITPEKLFSIIGNLDIGNSVAEDDRILEQVMVETSLFSDILKDKYDIICGRKGAGKTAIFRTIKDSLCNELLYEQNIVVLSGVNSRGEPIFNLFNEHFESFSEDDFENFWKLYFLTLIYNDFIKNESYQSKLGYCKQEINDFREECVKAGIPDIPVQKRLEDVIAWIIGKLPRIKKLSLPITVDPKGVRISGIPEMELEYKEKVTTETRRSSLYVQYVGDALAKVLEKSGFKIWILLDRLDEVFERYSIVEFNGLRGLLKAYKSFDIGEENELLKIKIFLRDDIKLFLTENDSYEAFFPGKTLPPLAAATHIFAKESPTLCWNETDIQKLLLRRLLLNKEIRELVGIEFNDIDKEQVSFLIQKELYNSHKRNYYWNILFPKKIASYKSLQWIFSRLKDGNGIVTPRSAIDLLSGAIEYNKTKLNEDIGDQSSLFSFAALRAGLKNASINKLYKDIFNEFPKEQHAIKVIEKRGKYLLTEEDAREFFGKDWEHITRSLVKIGVVKYIKNSGSYLVPFLYRPGLGMKY